MKAAYRPARLALAIMLLYKRFLDVRPRHSKCRNKGLRMRMWFRDSQLGFFRSGYFDDLPLELATTPESRLFEPRSDKGSCNTRSH